MYYNETPKAVLLFTGVDAGEGNFRVNHAKIHWDDIPLFPEDFEAWANDPVSPVLFALHKGMFVLGDGDLGDYDPAALTDRERGNVDIVLKEYWPYKPFQLSELTHREDPWKIARGDVPLGRRCNCVIQKLSMQEFYSGIFDYG